MKLRFTEQARADLHHLVNSVADYDLDRAVAVNRGLQTAFRAVAAAPLRCPVVMGSRSSMTRKKSWRPYLVLFQISGSETLILRIAYARSDWASLV